MIFKFFLSKFLKYGTLITSLGFVITVSLQIFARILFIYAIAFASGLAYRANYFIFLEAFYTVFSEKLKKIIDLISPLMSLVLFGFCAYYTVPMIKMGMDEYSPTLHVIMAIPFLSIFILSFSLSYFSFLGLINKIKFWKS